MKKNSPVIFLAVLGAAAAVAVTLPAELLKPDIQKNHQLLKARSLLEAFRYPDAEKLDDEKVLEVFQDKIKAEKKKDTVLYTFKDERGYELTGFEFSGRGMWGEIRGHMTLEWDGTTIRGIHFFQQSETPGLGGKIASEKFRNKFRGKQVIDGGQVLKIAVDGEKTGGSTVDAITGATLTMKKLNQILKRNISDYVEAAEIY